MGNNRVKRHYATLNNGAECQIHYASIGSGPSVVMLHPSPLSSAYMYPLMEKVSSQFRAIAWDTPGYGQSDPLVHNDGTLAPYVATLKAFVDALELKKPLLYGSATGAQIAIEFAKTYPDSVRGIVLENAASFTDEERAAWMEKYFPSIAPKDDGSHLGQVWDMVSQLFHFFPWFDTSESARVGNKPIPATVKQQLLMSYFTAGDNYPLAYKAAFENERAERLADVTVPTHIIRSPTSLLKSYVDRLDEIDLPPNIQMRPTESDIEDRFNVILTSFKTLSASED